MGRGINVFSHGAAWRPGPNPGADNQGAIRAGKRRTKSLDGAPVYLTVGRELREIVDEGGVDHAVRHRGSDAQTLQVFKMPSMHLSARGGKRFCTRIRASKSKHPMARAN